MRQFATTMNITDMQGYPISGDRLAFYVNGTETLATIYDSNGTSIENPVKVVNGKTAKQVFLGNETVKVVHQTCTDEENDVWVNVETWVDIPGHYDVTVEGGRPAVANLTALKAADTELGSVILEGYNEAGDCSAVTYVWNAACTETADNGTYVASNSTITGRWVAVWESEAVDVRHYGIFPTINMGTSQHASISSAYSILSALGKKMYFPSVGSKKYYEIGGCNINGAVFDDSIIVYAMQGYSYLTDCSNVKVKTYSNGGVVEVTGNDLCTSQNYDMTNKVILKPRKTITFDSDYSVETTWKDVEAILLIQQTHRQIFNTCTFSGTANFNSPTAVFKFSGCNIRQSLFASTTNFERIQFLNCTSSISLWSNYIWYIKFVQKNSSYEADLDGRTIEDRVDIGSDMKIKNGIIENINITGGNVTLENLTILKVFGCSCVSLTLKNVTVLDQTESGGSDLEATDKVYASQSTIGCGIEGAEIQMNGTTVGDSIYCNSISAVNCVFNGEFIYLTQKNGKVEDCLVSGCVFNGSSHVQIDSQVSGVILDDVYIVNNVFNGEQRSALVTNSLVDKTNSKFVVSNNTNSYLNNEESSSVVNTFNRIETNHLTASGVTHLYGVQIFNLYTATTENELWYRTWDVGCIIVLKNNTDEVKTYTSGQVGIDLQPNKTTLLRLYEIDHQWDDYPDYDKYRNKWERLDG